MGNGEALETRDSNPICLPPLIGGFFFVLLNFVPSMEFAIRSYLLIGVAGKVRLGQVDGHFSFTGLKDPIGYGG